MSLRPQIELAEAEIALIDPLIVEAWDRTAAVVDSYGDAVPADHRSQQICNLMLQAVAAQCDERGMTPAIILETIAKAFGCQVRYRCGEDTETAVGIMLTARSWMNDGYEEARAGVIESTGERH